MSVHVSSPVWLTEFPRGAMKTVALKIADCANDDGENIYPSVARVSRETGHSPSTVRDVYAAFEECGLVRVVSEGSGNRFNRSTTVRHVDLAKLRLLAAVDNRDGTFIPPTHCIKQIETSETKIQKGKVVPILLWAIVRRGEFDKSTYDDLAPPGWVHPSGERRGTPPDTGGVDGVAPPESGGVPLRTPDPTPPESGGCPSGDRTLTVNETSLNTHTQGFQKNGADTTSETSSNASAMRVCEEFNLKVSNWEMRVVENFIEPLAQSLTIRPKHHEAMAIMVEDLKKFSSRVLYLASRELRASRSVFPTIGDAMPVIEKIHKSEYRSVALTLDHPHLATWRQHLVNIGDADGIKRLDRLEPFDEFNPRSEYLARHQIDGNLLDDLLELQASTATADAEAVA